MKITKKRALLRLIKEKGTELYLTYRYRNKSLSKEEMIIAATIAAKELNIEEEIVSIAYEETPPTSIWLQMNVGSDELYGLTYGHVDFGISVYVKNQRNGGMSLLTLLHEFRHVYQLKNGLIDEDTNSFILKPEEYILSYAEIDANDFAYANFKKYMNIIKEELE